MSNQKILSFIEQYYDVELEAAGYSKVKIIINNEINENKTEMTSSDVGRNMDLEESIKIIVSIVSAIKYLFDIADIIKNKLSDKNLEEDIINHIMKNHPEYEKEDLKEIVGDVLLNYRNKKENEK